MQLQECTYGRSCIFLLSFEGCGGAEEAVGVLYQANWRKQQLLGFGPFLKKKPLYPPRGENNCYTTIELDYNRFDLIKLICLHLFRGKL